jgi:hypothetical protein
MTLIFLPGSRAVGGFDDVLTVEPRGTDEIALELGSFVVERAALRGGNEDMSGEVWRARALAHLPVRFTGALVTSKATTMALV